MKNFYPHKHIRTCRGGFSLIEVVMVIAGFSILFFTATALRSNVDTLKNISTQKLLSRQDIEQTIQIAVAEIRSAAPSSLGGYPIEAASSSSLTFYSDIDSDGLFEKVTYALSTSTIQKTVIKPSGNPLAYATSSQIVSTLVQYVTLATSTPLFQYFDSSYTGTQAPLASPIDATAVRLVKMSFYVDLDPQNAPRPTLFTNTIAIRNVKTN